MTCNIWGDNGGTRAAAPVLARLRGSSAAAGGAERQGAEHKQRRYGERRGKGLLRFIDGRCKWDKSDGVRRTWG
jgi:hypothetical protein